VDFFIQELDGDETILLASDGLTDLLEEREISEVIQKNLDLRQKAQTLIDTALAKGGYDNITVILVQLHEGGRS
jgi:protein phosphatase